MLKFASGVLAGVVLTTAGRLFANIQWPGVQIHAVAAQHTAQSSAAIGKKERLTQERPAWDEVSLRLYRTVGEKTEYWEIWKTTSEVVVHSGVLGTIGEMRRTPIEPNVGPSAIMESEVRNRLAEGFQQLKDGQLRDIVINYPIKGWGSPADIEKRGKVEDLVNDRLVWTGFGYCDGGSIGSGAMEVFCTVLDPRKSVRLITEELRKNHLLEGAVISDSSGDQDTLLWPPESKGRPAH
jgi:hypothetical protein